ncbi:unnamed protein product [Rhizophagus irregularis]|nr:unnamed protein product [Rhizophagus irregularis]
MYKWVNPDGEVELYSSKEFIPGDKEQRKVRMKQDRNKIKKNETRSKRTKQDRKERNKTEKIETRPKRSKQDRNKIEKNEIRPKTRLKQDRKERNKIETRSKRTKQDRKERNKTEKNEETKQKKTYLRSMKGGPKRLIMLMVYYMFDYPDSPRLVHRLDN